MVAYPEPDMDIDFWCRNRVEVEGVAEADVDAGADTYADAELVVQADISVRLWWCGWDRGRSRQKYNVEHNVEQVQIKRK